MSHSALSKKVCSLNERGFDLQGGGEYDKSLPLFEEALQLDPRNGDAHVGRGQVRLNEGNVEEALADFEEAIRLVPTDAGAYCARGTVHFLRGDYAPALADFSEEIRLKPDCSFGYLNRGMAFQALTQHTSAVADFTSAIRLAPVADYFYRRSQAYLDCGELTLALADLDEAIKLDPDSPRPHEEQAKILYKLARYHDSIAAATSALEREKEAGSRCMLFNRRAVCYAAVGEHERALVDYSDSLALSDGKDAVVLCNRGMSRYSLSDYEAALADFTECVRLKPESIDYRQWRARCYFAQQAFDLAIRDCEETLRLNPNATLSLYIRGRAWYELDAYETALADLSECVRLEPSNADNLYWRARCYECLDELVPAIQDLDEALLLRPGDPLYIFWRGRARYESEDYEAALADFNECVRLEPDDVDNINWRGLTYKKLEQYEAALTDFADAIRGRPESGELYFNRGLTHYLFESYHDGVADLEEAVRLGFATDDTYLYMALSLYKLNDHARAADAWEEVLRRGPNDDLTRPFLALALWHLDDLEPALQLLEEAERLHPDQPFTYVVRSMIWYGIGEADLALRDLYRALEWGSRVGPHQRLGCLWEELHEYDKALSHFDEALKLEPDAETLYARSRIWDILGNDSKAAADFESAQRLESAEGEDDVMLTEDRMMLYNRVQEHFDARPLDQIRRTTRNFPPRVLADLQLAADDLGKNGEELVYFAVPQKGACFPEFPDLYQKDRRNPPQPGAPQYEEIDIGENQPVRCLHSGLWLLKSGDTRFAVLLNAFTHRGISYQIAAPDTAEGERVTQEVFQKMEESVKRSRCYRGKILSLEMRDSYSGQSCGVLVHRLRKVEREEVILPAKTLELLDRNVVKFVQRRKRLFDLGLSLKKGLLFYGPPGTGKTHTIHYLTGVIKGHTTFLITAEEIGLLGDYLTLARLLQPSTVVIEDVDLIARERAYARSGGEESLLNKLLNEMDGLRPDAEVLFILTTNHPESLEGALASRPGRIDQAIEFPLPDADGRARLVRLYSQKLQVAEKVVEHIVRKSDNVTASFIKELMRRAAQFALERDDTSQIEDTDVEAALEELLHTGGSLNAKLLGAHTSHGFAVEETNNEASNS